MHEVIVVGPVQKYGNSEVMNKLGDMIIGCQMISTLIFACTLVLWFLMTVVLYPEQMITVIACVAGALGIENGHVAHSESYCVCRLFLAIFALSAAERIAIGK
eukprot:1976811-Amphidinium_carterae.1